MYFFWCFRFLAAGDLRFSQVNGTKVGEVQVAGRWRSFPNGWKIHFPKTNSKSPRKWMVGILVSGPWDGLFSGAFAVSFREGNSLEVWFGVRSFSFLFMVDL